MEPKNSVIKQFTALLRADNVNVKFDQAFLEKVAEKVMKKGTGARGLRTFLEDALLDLCYTSPDNKMGQDVVITKDYLKDE